MSDSLPADTDIVSDDIRRSADQLGLAIHDVAILYSFWAELGR